MNRYIAEGILKDLTCGKRVLILGNNRPAARNAFLVTIESIADPEAFGVKAWRSGAGRERLEMENGGTLAVATVNGSRGLTVDSVVLINWEEVMGRTFEKVDQNFDALLATGAELIQA